MFLLCPSYLDNGSAHSKKTDEESEEKSPVNIGGGATGTSPLGGGAGIKGKAKKRKEKAEGRVLYDKDKVGVHYLR